MSNGDRHCLPPDKGSRTQLNTSRQLENGFSNAMLRIITQLPEIRAEMARIGDRLSEAQARVPAAAIREILDSVRKQGDRELCHQTEKWAQQSLSPSQLRVSGSELDAAYQQISKELLDAIQEACRKLETYHRQRLPKSWVQFGEEEVAIGKRYLPIQRAGLYIPAKEASPLSQVLGLAVPAKVAGVARIVMVTPPKPGLKVLPEILVAAQEAGVNEIYRIEGATAIAALAYGTETVPKVEAIVGTGDLEVALAKQMVGAIAGLDFPAGCGDGILIADGEANPVQVAADLLAQAEQDSLAAAILLTPDRPLAEAVQRQVQQQLSGHPQGLLVEKAIAHYGLIALVDSLAEAIELSNSFAPQVLILAVRDPWALLEEIRQAGTIFLGLSTPKAVGDYLGGTGGNFPRTGLAHYTSGVGVETFLKATSLFQYSTAALKKLANPLQILSQAEGLAASAEAVRLRTQGQTGKRKPPTF